MDSKVKKVLNGLKCCLSEEYRHLSDNNEHGDCPYRNIQYGCIIELHKDVYEILKGREVRPNE